jgi:hypothetical protein
MPIGKASTVISMPSILRCLVDWGGVAIMKRDYQTADPIRFDVLSMHSLSD